MKEPSYLRIYSKVRERGSGGGGELPRGGTTFDTPQLPSAQETGEGGQGRTPLHHIRMKKFYILLTLRKFTSVSVQCTLYITI